MMKLVISVVVLAQACVAQIWHPFAEQEYFIGNIVRGYYEAELNCAQLNSNLANIKTSPLGNFLSTIVSTSGRLYIGAKRNRFQFQWTDGSDASYVTDSAFSFGNCATFQSSISWRFGTLPCIASARYICQRKLAGYTTGDATATDYEDYTNPTYATKVTAKSDNQRPSTKTAEDVNTDATDTSQDNNKSQSIAILNVGGFIILIALVISVALYQNRQRFNKKTNDIMPTHHQANGQQVPEEHLYEIPLAVPTHYGNFPMAVAVADVNPANAPKPCQPYMEPMKSTPDKDDQPYLEPMSGSSPKPETDYMEPISQCNL